jgi:hypothetical protein
VFGISIKKKNRTEGNTVWCTVNEAVMHDIPKISIVHVKGQNRWIHARNHSGNPPEWMPCVDVYPKDYLA